MHPISLLPCPAHIKKATPKSGFLFDSKSWCPDADSNHGHKDFQSFALPTELSGHCSFKNVLHKLLFFTDLVKQKVKNMNVKLIKQTIQNQHFTFNCIGFIPPHNVEIRSEWALLTHGYTASKSDCISWASRLSEAGIPCCIFDLPGHHLGSFNYVNSLDDFTSFSHECFLDAFQFLSSQLSSGCEKIILAGHSLGGLLAIKALELDAFEHFEKLAISIGIGISQHKHIHLFESSFYQKTLNIRRQLIDAKIDSNFIFPWVMQEKKNLSLTNQRIHLITGADDVVVGPGGLETLRSNLVNLNNNVTAYEPRKLPHHEPSLAATHIYSFLKKELSL